MNYYESFILVAPDSTAAYATVPPAKGATKSIPALEHELLSKSPYTYKQEELQVAVHLAHEGISETEASGKTQTALGAVLRKPRACFARIVAA